MIIDMHCHIMDDPADRAGIDRLLEIAARFDIRQLITSMGKDLVVHPTPEQIREANDHVISLVKGWPGRIFGYCYLNPRLGRNDCLDEVQRCLDAGLIAIKLWVACACNQPEVFPIVERAIDLDIPILQHTWRKTGGNGPDETEPRQMADLARRYPRAKLIMAHCGGAWEYGVKAVRACPNVVVDTSGANPTQGFLEMALRDLGPGRIVFGTDAPLRSFASQLAKVDAVTMSAQVRRMILQDNAVRLFNLPSA
jgi:predicted TIM-barrel fold metal-dependent hydrolase